MTAVEERVEPPSSPSPSPSQAPAARPVADRPPPDGRRASAVRSVAAVAPPLVVATAATAGLFTGPARATLWIALALAVALEAIAAATGPAHRPRSVWWIAAHVAGLAALITVAVPTGLDGAPALREVLSGARRLLSLPPVTAARGPELAIAVAAVWAAGATAMRLAGRPASLPIPDDARRERPPAVSPVSGWGLLPPVVLTVVAVALRDPRSDPSVPITVGLVASAGWFLAVAAGSRAAGAAPTSDRPVIAGPGGHAATDDLPGLASTSTGGSDRATAAMRGTAARLVPALVIVVLLAGAVWAAAPSWSRPDDERLDLRSTAPATTGFDAVEDPLLTYQRVRAGGAPLFRATVAVGGSAPDQLLWRAAVLDRLGGGGWEVSPQSFQPVGSELETGALGPAGAASGDAGADHRFEALVEIDAPTAGATLLPLPDATSRIEAPRTAAVGYERRSAMAAVAAPDGGPTGAPGGASAGPVRVGLEGSALDPRSAASDAAVRAAVADPDPVSGSLPVTAPLVRTGADLADLAALERWFTRTDLFAVSPPEEGLTGSGLRPVVRLLCGDGDLAADGGEVPGTGPPAATEEAAPSPTSACVTPGADGRPRVASPDTYASAFALVARQSGFDVRLATGARTGTGGTVVADAVSVAVWPEVRFDGVGWVPFWPLPDRELSSSAVPLPTRPSTPTTPAPVIAPSDASGAGADAAAGAGAAASASPTGLVLAIAAVLFVVATVVIAARIAVVRARRRRRRAAREPRARARAAWAAAEDELRRLGVALPANATRREVVAAGAAIDPDLPAEDLERLAEAVDRAQFDPGFNAIDDPWPLVDRLRSLVDRATGPTGRLRAALGR